MPTQIITTDDLKEFKEELLQDIKKLFKLKEDKELLNLVAKDEILKPLLFKGEGYHIIVKEENVKTVLKRLESFGYYND